MKLKLALACVLCLSCVVFGQEKKYISVCGHRGFAGKYPENTLLGFEKALELEIDSMEYDVCATKDDVPVISHDNSIERCSNGKGKLSEMTLEEARKFDYGYRRGKLIVSQKLPTIFEVFDLVEKKNPKVVQLIELKTANRKAIDKILVDVERRNLFDKVTFVSFNWKTLRYIKGKYPQAKLHGNPGKRLDAPLKAEDYVGMFKAGCQHQKVTKEMVDWFHQQGVLVDAWTINHAKHALRVAECGVDSITSDRPDIIIKALKENGWR